MTSPSISSWLRNAGIGLIVIAGFVAYMLYNSSSKIPVATFESADAKYEVSKVDDIWVLTGSDGNHWVGNWNGSTFTGSLVGIKMAADVILRPDPKGPEGMYLVSLAGAGVPLPQMQTSVKRTK